MNAERSRGLVFDHVGRRFGVGGRWAALTGLTVRCDPGEILCLVGPNGAGKSTALALAAGLLATSNGEIRFAGGRVTPTSPVARQGYLAQRSAFAPGLTVGDVLDFAVAARGSNEEQRAESIALGDLEGVLGRRTRELSSGWLRRLDLAIALLPPTDLLLLDEPLAGLDLATLERSLPLLTKRAEEGAVVVLSSHDFEVVDRLRPQVAVLDAGRLLACESSAGVGCRAVYGRALAPPPAAGDPVVAEGTCP
ncbi:MAG TPA: ATP-binding cassette domain-containing protein [Thermoanaerobaculia bacterium]|nr:ATP-binding cassette domain-containing protein [Thermoanaerobaculia bacterium]